MQRINRKQDPFIRQSEEIDQSLIRKLQTQSINLIHEDQDVILGRIND